MISAADNLSGLSPFINRGRAYGRGFTPAFFYILGNDPCAEMRHPSNRRIKKPSQPQEGDAAREGKSHIEVIIY